MRLAFDEAMGASEQNGRPLLMVDIDGVISLHGVPDGSAIEGRLCTVDGFVIYLSQTAAQLLLELQDDYELVWASGWEERADEHLPHLLGLPRGLSHLRFERAVGTSHAHWKLEAIEAHAEGRPLAWIDDSLDAACESWAAEREAPTLLVRTDPRRGLTDAEARELRDWAAGLS